MQKFARALALVSVLVLGLPALALAQASGIAGVVKDSSGAVMPGVNRRRLS